MPLYEYECKDCGKIFEKILGWADIERPQACPACKSQNTSRKVSAAGWYSSFSSASNSGSSSCSPRGGFS